MAVAKLNLQIGKLFVPPRQILQGLFRLCCVCLRRLELRHFLDKLLGTEPLLASLAFVAPNFLSQSVNLLRDLGFTAIKSTQPSLLLGSQAFGSCNRLIASRCLLGHETLFVDDACRIPRGV